MVRASAAIIISGRGANGAKKIPASSGKSPHQRQESRQSSIHNPPKVIDTSAESGKAGVTVTAQVAVQRRDEARDRYRVGSGLMIAGGAVLVGTLIWVIIDWVMTPRGP